MSAEGSPSEPAAGRSSLAEVTWLFFKLGCIAFGGPAAHIALMREEVVRRRGWLTDQRFLDLVGASNLIPGPTSTELAVHIGHSRAGWRGLVAAGTAFILPAVLIVLVIAWAYDRYRTLPAAEWLLYGVKPVIIAVVAQALWALGKAAIKGPITGAAGVVALVMIVFGVNEIATLLVVGLGVMVIVNAARLRQMGPAPKQGVGTVLPFLFAPVLPAVTSPVAATPIQVFLVFLKIGSVLFGSGYVLLAFLRADLVERLGWLSEGALIDAVAVGQFTPGPVFTTATFIGYLVGGVPTAIAATVGIFLPAFAFVAISAPFIPRLRASPWTRALLDGVNVASLALMAAVTALLARSALWDAPVRPFTIGLALLALALLHRFKVNSAWLV
ncbi:MAG: chromate efflux transporter, partial [Dehalococcoidia bacterium]